MKKLKIHWVISGIAIIGIVASLISANPAKNEDIKEIVRQKIENIEILNPVETEPIYCIASVKQVYLNNNFYLLWRKKEEVDEFIVEIGKAKSEGLNPDDYHYKELIRLKQIKNQTYENIAEHDILLTDAFLLYASHILSGKVDPVTIDADWHVARREGNPVDIFNATISSNNYTLALQELIPNSNMYQKLKAALANYQEIQQNGGWKEIPSGRNIKVGMEDTRIPLIKERLIRTNDLSIKIDSSLLYDERLQEAIIKFQKRHGFPGDCIIDEPTIIAMNVPVEERIKQIKVNLERWRWLPQEFSNYYILVNIANFELDVIKNGKTEREYKVIVGKPFRKTPVFSDKISYIVLNPTWTVPPTILKNDIIPAVQKDINYLSKKNIKVLDHSGNEIAISAIDWQTIKSNGFPYKLVQDPGPDNALGAVKLMFPNKYNVYLHDTPSRELFSKSDRAFSSGCIRVENPIDLTVYLLNENNKWDKEKILKIIETRKTQTVMLPEKLNIHIMYWTAWADENNTTHFRNDVYDRDSKILHALKQSNQ